MIQNFIIESVSLLFERKSKPLTLSNKRSINLRIFFPRFKFLYKSYENNFIDDPKVQQQFFGKRVFKEF